MKVALTLLLSLCVSSTAFAQNDVRRQMEVDQARVQAMSALNALELHHDAVQQLKRGQVAAPPADVQQRAAEDVQRKTQYWSEWLAGLPR